MDKAIDWLKQVQRLFWVAAETGLALVGLALVVFLLLGDQSGGFILSIVENTARLVTAISAPAIIGIALLAALIALITRRI
jgi:nitrate reductase gamma subunit